jgi:hypothetical protein
VRVKIEILQDEMAESPREWDNLGEMICFHKRYNLGDKHSYSVSDFISWESMRESFEREDDPAEVILPLYLYDHGGITMSTKGFSCPWDSGQVGFILARRSAILNCYSKKRISSTLRERVREVLETEVKTYDQYLTGDVWGYVIEDDSGEHVDSCWGFFGHDHCEKEAEEALKYAANN